MNQPRHSSSNRKWSLTAMSSPRSVSALLLLMNGVLQGGVMAAALMHSPRLDASGSLSLLNGAGYVILMIWLGYSVACKRHLLLAGVLSGLFGASFLVSTVLVVVLDFPHFLLFFFLAYGAMLTPASVLLLVHLLGKAKTHDEAGGQ